MKILTLRLGPSSAAVKDLSALIMQLIREAKEVPIAVTALNLIELVAGWRSQGRGEETASSRGSRVLAEDCGECRLVFRHQPNQRSQLGHALDVRVVANALSQSGMTVAGANDVNQSQSRDAAGTEARSEWSR